MKLLTYSLSKMEKPTAAQITAMVKFMEEHSDFAKNKVHSDSGKQSVSRLWIRLGQMLNALGPPVRDLKKWKQVFAFYSIKIKLIFENKYSRRGRTLSMALARSCG